MTDPAWLDDHRPAPRDPRPRMPEPQPAPEITFPSLIYGLDEAIYHADPCPTPSLSSSCAHTLVTQSPKHAHHEHPRLGGNARTPTKAMDRGAAIDHLLLGGGRPFHVVHADSWRKKVDQAEKKEAIAAGLHPVLPHELETYEAAADGIRAELALLGIDLELGHRQVSAFWIELAEDGTEVPCRARFDHLVVSSAGALLSDLKTVESAAEPDVQRAIDQRDHDIQAVAYERAIAACLSDVAGRVEWRWLFAEHRAPYGCRIARPFGTMRALGEARWQWAVNGWAQCTATGEWPGYPTTPMLVEAKPWKLREAGLQGEMF